MFSFVSADVHGGFSVQFFLVCISVIERVSLYTVIAFFGASGRMCFVIEAFTGLLYFYFFCVIFLVWNVESRLYPGAGGGWGEGTHDVH